MCQREPTACIGITAEAVTVTLDGKAVLVVPRERMLDLMVRIGIALRDPPLQRTRASAESEQLTSTAALRTKRSLSRK